MSRYLYLYKGPATPMEQFTPEQTAEQTKAWGDWMNGVGAALVDPGAPFAERDAVAAQVSALEAQLQLVRSWGRCLFCLKKDRAILAVDVSSGSRRAPAASPTSPPATFTRSTSIRPPAR